MMATSSSAVDKPRQEWVVKLKMQRGDLLALYRVAGVRSASHPCLEDHAYARRAGGDNALAPESDCSIIAESTPLKFEIAKAVVDDDDDGVGDSVVVELKEYSVLDEHSYSKARFFSSDDIWKKATVVEEEIVEVVAYEDNVDLVGNTQFSDSSIIIDGIVPEVSYDVVSEDASEPHAFADAPQRHPVVQLPIPDTADEESKLDSAKDKNSTNESVEREARNILGDAASTIDYASILDEVLNEGSSSSSRPGSVSIWEPANEDGRRGTGGEFTLTVHSCKICDRVFDGRADLVKHYSTHARDKNSLACSNCGAAFHSAVELLIHRKRHEKCGGKRDGGRAVVAAAAKSVRRRRSSSSNSFSEDVIPPEIHRAKNTIYRCLHCSKPFYNFTQLAAHQENHSADKDQFYKCPICWESFTSLALLILHGNQHEEDGEGARSRDQ